MQRKIMTVVSLSVLVVIALLRSETTGAAGIRDAYCLEYNEGGTDCSFISLAQCNATAAGIDAECYAVAPPPAAIQEPAAITICFPSTSFATEVGRPPAGTTTATPIA